MPPATAFPNASTAADSIRVFGSSHNGLTRTFRASVGSSNSSMHRMNRRQDPPSGPRSPIARSRRTIGASSVFNSSALMCDFNSSE